MVEVNEKENFFAKVFQKLLDFLKEKNVSQDKENEVLAEFGTMLEEDAEYKNNPDALSKDDILEICLAIDHTNETIQKWYDEGQPDVTKFGVKEVTELAKEIDPEMSEEKIKSEIDKTVNFSVTESARGIADEIAGEGNEISDEEMEEIEKLAKREEE